MSKLILYHGSPKIIQTPILGKGKSYNDYGKGFYCTEHLELAKEWACMENEDGYANKYELDTNGLSVLNLSSDEYTILHWLALLMEYRKFRISTPVMKRGADWLKEHFLLDLTQYDAVVGYRADDSYFSFATAFLNNTISLSKLEKAMQLGKLGEQVVAVSKEAFERFSFVQAEFSPKNINAFFGNGKVVFLCDLDFAMAHLVLKQMWRRVQLCHDGSKSVAEEMVLKVQP